MTKRTHFTVLGTLAAIAIASCLAGSTQASAYTGTLVQQVKAAATKYRDVKVAEADGYGLATGCVSDESAGVMGVHYVKISLLGDGQLDPAQPEALVYEPTPDGRMRLVAAEFITLADVWDASHPMMTPVLSGQQFFYEGAPNRYAFPPAYELHVWAFANNPNGMFASWNPTLSCANYVPSS